jgi:peptidoglycan glycosyltransferase
MVRPRSRRRLYYLGVGAAVAAVVAVTAQDDAPGAQLANQPLVRSAAAATTAIETEETEPALPLVGDAAFAGALDMTTVTRVGDHYEAKLGTEKYARLTLEPKFQEAAAAILRESRAPRGAVVILDPDGSVLALAGRRAASPNGSVEGTPDPALALDSWAPAASIFKIVTAAALVEAGVRPDDKVCFHGGVRSVMESNLTDSKSDSRCESLTYGVAHSQNAIIAKLVHQKLVPDDLRRTAQALGVDGDTAPWALAGKAGSITIPSEKGVELGKTAAGFIGSEMSPVGAALLASTIGNHGLVAPPRIIAAVIDGDHVQEIGAPEAHQAIPARDADQVAAMMASTCNKGSAAKSFRRWKGAKVAGKTGTLGVDKPVYVEYSWFVGFIETDRGSVAIAVVLGNAEDWWMKAHTAARRVLERALKPSS